MSQQQKHNDEEEEEEYLEEVEEQDEEAPFIIADEDDDSRIRAEADATISTSGKTQQQQQGQPQQQQVKLLKDDSSSIAFLFDLANLATSSKKELALPLSQLAKILPDICAAASTTTSESKDCKKEEESEEKTETVLIQRFSKAIAIDGEITKSDAGSPALQNFHEQLKRLDFDLHLYSAKGNSSLQIQRGTDVALACRLLELADVLRPPVVVSSSSSSSSTNRKKVDSKSSKNSAFQDPSCVLTGDQTTGERSEQAAASTTTSSSTQNKAPTSWINMAASLQEQKQQQEQEQQEKQKQMIKEEQEAAEKEEEEQRKTLSLPPPKHVEVVLFSSDSDLEPAIEMALERNPYLKITVVVDSTSLNKHYKEFLLQNSPNLTMKHLRDVFVEVATKRNISNLLLQKSTSSSSSKSDNNKYDHKNHLLPFVLEIRRKDFKVPADWISEIEKELSRRSSTTERVILKINQDDVLADTDLAALSHYFQVNAPAKLDQKVHIDALSQLWIDHSSRIFSTDRGETALIDLINTIPSLREIHASHCKNFSPKLFNKIARNIIFDQKRFLYINCASTPAAETPQKSTEKLFVAGGFDCKTVRIQANDVENRKNFGSINARFVGDFRARQQQQQQQERKPKMSEDEYLKREFGLNAKATASASASSAAAADSSSTSGRGGRGRGRGDGSSNSRGRVAHRGRRERRERARAREEQSAEEVAGDTQKNNNNNNYNNNDGDGMTYNRGRGGRGERGGRGHRGGRGRGRN